MQETMRDRHGAFVLELGAIRPFLMLGAMAVPELAAAARKWPESLPLEPDARADG